MTEEEKKEILQDLKKEIEDEIAIYVGSSILKGIARILGIGLIALTYYLTSHGYIKI
jgi:hypothetical protein